MTRPITTKYSVINNGTLDHVCRYSFLKWQGFLSFSNLQYTYNTKLDRYFMSVRLTKPNLYLFV